MKKNISIFIVAAMIISLFAGIGAIQVKNVSAAPVCEKVNFTNAIVATDALNVRSGTSLDHKVLCQVKKNQSVIVLGKISDWYCVYVPNSQCVGVASSKYLKPATSTTPSAEKKSSQQQSAPQAKPSAPAAQKPITQASQPPTSGINAGSGNTGSNISTPELANPKPDGITKEEQELIDYVNKARTNAGLQPLNFDIELVKVARTKAKDMVDKNYFSHTSPTYGSPFEMMRQFNISYKTAGENIAGNQSIKSAFDAWMNSEGHRKNILNSKFNFCGFGIVPSTKYGKILVQMFIGR